MEQITDTIPAIQQIVSDNADSTSIWSVWLIVAVSAGALILLCVVLFVSRDKKKDKIKARVLNDTAGVDFSAFNNDWKKTELLYNELKRKCHPDLFHDERKEEANRLFQRLTENKYRYAELLKIQDEAIEKLGIKTDKI